MSEEQENSNELASSKNKYQKNLRAWIKIFNLNGLLEKDTFARQFPFILWIVALSMFYIYNGYAAEARLRKIDAVKKELKEKRNEYISVSSEFMFRSKQTEVARLTAPFDLKESKNDAPHIIHLHQTTTEQ
ncbi:MAG: hypothetical protein RIQ89_858 [Bacteroidota bacterium]|jgi:hypothetical protein